MRTEGASKSWKGIGDMQSDQLSTMFPVDDLSIMCVSGESDLPDLMNALVKCKFIPIIRPTRLDILVQVTAQTKFHLWASKLSESMKWIPDAFICFNRPLKNTAGHELSFFVIQSSASGIANKLEPDFLSVRLLSEGATLARKPFKAQRPDPDIQVDEKDIPHAMQKLGLQGAQCYLHQGRTRRKVMDKHPPLNTKFFHAPLTGVRLQKLGDYGGTDHFSLMTLDEYHSRGLQKSALVCQVFYKKNMKDKYARRLWYTLYQALLQALAEPSRWSLPVRGYNKMRLAFHEENDAADFSKRHQWNCHPKDCSSRMSASNDGSKTPPPTLSRTAPFPKRKQWSSTMHQVKWNQEAVGASLQSAGFSISNLSRMGWNPGTPHGAAWRLTGTGLLGRSGCILHDADQDITMALISLSEYQDIKSSLDKPSTLGKGRRKATYAGAAASTLLKK